MVLSSSAFSARTNGHERRSDGLWTHTGRFIVSGGPVDLPAGAIDTSELAANAAQAYLGSYYSGVSFTISPLNTWVESPAQVTVTTTGGVIRLEALGTLIGSAQGAITYVGLGIDGTCTQASLQVCQQPLANYIVPFHVLTYQQPAAGSHRFALFLYANTASGGLWSGGITSLYVNEQKR